MCLSAAKLEEQHKVLNRAKQLHSVINNVWILYC
jgi:hypothetical protein